MTMKIKKKHPMKSGVFVCILFVAIGAIMGVTCHWGCAVAMSVFGVFFGQLEYFSGRGSRAAKRILWGSLIVIWVIVPCVVFVGGIDIDPVDDKDLLLPENGMSYDPEGNGWSVLSNVLSQIEVIGSERDDTNNCLRDEAYLASKDLLCWYADPRNREEALCRIGDDREECLSNFTNRATACSYVESLLQSNEWVLTGIDSAIAADRFAPPPVGMLTDHHFCLPVSEMLTVNRCFLLARVRCEFERGNHDAGVEALRKALGLATLLQTKCGTIVGYLAWMCMIADDVSCIDQILADTALPKSALSSLNDSLDTLIGFSSDAMARALKREYAYLKENLRRARIDGLEPEKSKLYKTINLPICRYCCHPNRTMRDIASRLRQLIDSDFQILEHCDRLRNGRKKWYDVCMPNSWGQIYVSCGFERHLSRVKEIEKDVLSLKSKISRILVSNESGTLTSSYFPLVATNGCFYTHDLKHIVGVAKSSEFIVVGGDVEIGEATDFSHAKKIIVKPECEGWLETWYDALRDPTNLVDVCVGADDVVIGKTCNLIYERKSGRIINIYGNEKSVTIPENLVVPDIDKFVEQLQCHDIERLHFEGSLPDFSRRIPRNSHRWRIARWWKYGGWKYFKRIFEMEKHRLFLDRARSDLTITVSRKNADGRTKKIVESGMWEGRTIRWKESE